MAGVIDDTYPPKKLPPVKKGIYHMAKNDQIFDNNDGILAELEGVEEGSAEEYGVNTFKNGQIGHVENILIRGIIWGGEGR